MKRGRTVVIGAGIGGLVAAIELARRGEAVLVVDKAAAPGGKMREIRVGGQQLDAGPTVLTLRAVFEEIFRSAGSTLAEHVTLVPLEILARHAWMDGSTLDLHADPARAADAIAQFAGASEARGFLAFNARARSIYETLEESFIRSASPTPVSLVRHAGVRGLRRLAGIAPFSTMWDALGTYFHDPRLRQLFGRYATYCGSSPFAAPATLMLIAHVEQQGVWQVQGGMHQLARALETLGRAQGVEYRYGVAVDEIQVTADRATGVVLAGGETITAATIVMNADAAALQAGRLGMDARRALPAPGAALRSLSAVTWNIVARTSRFPLSHHNVFFSDDYPAEFRALFQEGRLPDTPTVYICAQDRDSAGGADAAAQGAERLFCLANAPARGDAKAGPSSAFDRYEDRVFALLERCGLSIERAGAPCVRTTPADFEALFPATGGALYGQASHGWNASFARPGATTRIAGLYLAGGSVHPGAGVPMAALSGKMAAARILDDRTRP